MLFKKIIFPWLLSGLTALLTVYGYSTHSHAQATNSIVINQVGYQPNWSKTAFLLKSKPTDLKTAEVVDLASGETVFTLQPGQPQSDTADGNAIYPLDFSALRQPGTYYLRVGNSQSAPFQIGVDIYQEPLVKLLRSYYLQRCGVAIDDPLTGIHHAPCHVKDGIIAHTDAIRSIGEPFIAPGGWHDAGDYGKYVTTTAVSIGRLLSLYEQHPDLFWDNQLEIPESGNGVPDLLDEMHVGLDWLLTMQRQDGAVYRKLSGDQWPIGLAPDEDTQARYVYGISTPETAKFTAVMAMAARVYQSIQPAQADIYLSAAESAWQFLTTQPTMQVDWVAGDDSGSGKYLFSETDPEASLKTDLDDRLWAASELFITTGKPSFEQYFSQHLDVLDYTLFEWKDPSPLAMTDYLMQTRQPSLARLRAKIQTKLLQRANVLLDRVNDSGYRLANHRFIWGSNKMAAEEGITLAYAYRLTHNPAYRQAALDQLDFLLGRNPFNQTFVTGVGTHPVQHVNHLFARAKQIDIPGLVVGGPNADAQDGIAPKGQGLLSYIDDAGSYATNEYAIDYNASLIGLIGILLQSA
ncbi:MAG: glycosyl hydrolase family 5 [Cyanothece sp. SIO1E1]|nr:glycosyl hydrolase family 5 [Cyanothece sp. SIO1E1]